MITTVMIFETLLIYTHGSLFCFAPAFRRRRHYVFGLSVRPSIRSLKYPLSTSTRVRLSIPPTVSVLRDVRPSVCPFVRPEMFPCACCRTHGENVSKFCMLMYLGHRQNWLDYSHGLLTFLHLATLWLSEKGQIWGFRAFPEERI